MDMSREHTNTFQEYTHEIVVSDSHGSKLEQYLSNKIHNQIENLLINLENGYSVDFNDISVYTGTTGVALMYYHVYRKFQSKNNSIYLKKALVLIEKSLDHIKLKKFSFLGGDGGLLAVATVLYSEIGEAEKSDACLQRLLSLNNFVLENDSVPDEILFGRAGYLFALLYVQQNLGKVFDEKYIKKLVKKILDNGKTFARDNSISSPLMYEWHGSMYLGAAHGLAGIIYILLLLKDNPSVSQYFNDLVRPTIDFMLQLQYPSGNFPSSLGSTSDKLVHWCHGAPGSIYMFLEAYKIFGHNTYLKAAMDCGEVIWKRGLLKKGYGLCHGAAGNAYAFLALYNATKNMKFLYKASKFAEWCCDYGKHGNRIADRPYSLFEGMAGTIYFLVDILQPNEAKFPAFQL